MGVSPINVIHKYVGMSSDYVVRPSGGSLVDYC